MMCCDVLHCFVAAVCSLLSITLLPDSLTWVEKPKYHLMPGKEKKREERKKENADEELTFNMIVLSCSS